MEANRTPLEQIVMVRDGLDDDDGEEEEEDEKEVVGGRICWECSALCQGRQAVVLTREIAL